MNTYKRYGCFSSGCLADASTGLLPIDKEVNPSQQAEASLAGLVLLKRSTDPNYNLYRIKSCGHTQYIQPTHVRRKNFKCRTCLLNSEASMFSASGFTYLHRTKGPQRLVIKPCGCVASLVAQTIARHLGKVCKTCFIRDVHLQAEKLEVDILSRDPDNRFNISFRSCGHTRSTHHSQFFAENLECAICKEENYKIEADLEGLVYNGLCNPHLVPDHNQKRNYTLPCGHVRDFRMSHVRESRWQCDICKDSHFLKPSFVYLVQLDTPTNSFLKLGYARDVQTRIACYGLKGAVAKEISKVKFPTGREAIQFENTLHRKYQGQNIPKTTMAAYMDNGKTECYPITMTSRFLNEFETKTKGTHVRKRE